MISAISLSDRVPPHLLNFTLIPTPLVLAALIKGQMNTYTTAGTFILDMDGNRVLSKYHAKRIFHLPQTVL